MKPDLPPLDYTPPPSGDVEHFRLALNRARERLNSLERLRDRQRITFSDRYPLKEYDSSESCDTSAGAANEEREPRAEEPRSAANIDNNKEVDL